MSSVTIYNDIAGRITRETSMSNSITVAGVAIETSVIADIEKHLPPSFPKWCDCQSEHLSAVVELLTKDTVSMSAVSFNKKNSCWTSFWNAADLFHERIVKQAKKPAGFVKAANIVKYWLFGYSITLATAHAIKLRAVPEIYDYNHFKIVERSLVFDTDIQGDDNIQTFSGMLENSECKQPKVASLGLRITNRSISFENERAQRLLLLADYLAGITHCYINGLSFGISGASNTEIAKAFETISNSQKFILAPFEFNLKYSDIFAGLVADETGSDDDP